MTNLVSQVLATADIELPIGDYATKNNFFGYTCIGHLVSNVVSAAFIISGIAFFVYLVWGDIEYLTSGGDKAKVSEAQTQMTQAAVGLIAMISSYFIIGIVGAVLGIDILNPFKTLFG